MEGGSPPLTPRQLHAAAVLDAWTAIEVLSPQTFDRPDELLMGTREELVRLATAPGGLPWECGAVVDPEAEFVYFYKILLGSQRLDLGWAALQEKFPSMIDGELEGRNYAPLASIVVDQAGCLVEANWGSVASFAWGLPRALADQLETLHQWPQAELSLQQGLETSLLPALLEDTNALHPLTPYEARREPLNYGDFLRSYHFLLQQCGLPEAWVAPPEFAVRVEVLKRKPKPGQATLPETPPEPLLVSGFYLADLLAARHLCTRPGDGLLEHNLGRYLGCLPPDNPRNLLTDRAALDEALCPRLTPLAKWPAGHDHSLSLLQQAAVNLSFAETAPTGLLGINGPPGTGKTTLIRDILAEVVTQRAMLLCNYDTPAQAFHPSGLEHSVGGGINVELFYLAPELKGFEVIVASSNNRAVENVSAELPSLGAIQTLAEPFTYLKTLGDSLHQMETWGAVAAVLGNAGNRSRFVNRFWWDDEKGLRRYLLAACGLPYEIPVLGTSGKTKVPEIVRNEKPPLSQQEAMVRWQQAQREFREALKKSAQCRVWLEKCHESLKQQQQLQTDLAASKVALAQATAAAAVAQAARRQYAAALQQIEESHAAAQQTRMRLTDAQQARDTATARCQLATAREKRHLLEKPTALKAAFQKHALADWEVALAQHKLEAAEAAQQLVAANRDFQLAVLGLGPTGPADPAVLEAEMRRLAVAKLQAAADEEMLTEKAAAAQTQILALQDELEALEFLLGRTRERPGTQFIDEAFWELSHAQRHLSSPWQPVEAQRAREALFYAALNLHKAFLDAAAAPLRQNLTVLMQVFRSQTLSTPAKQAMLPDLWSTLSLVVPLFSTTFASVARMFGQLPPGSLGWLIVDEAAQATPQSAVGAVFRAKRVLMLGDPVQLEPVVLLPSSVVSHICTRFGVSADVYGAPRASAQSLADAASRYHTEFFTSHRPRRVGVPLLVHRRCSEPMFSIANEIAYANQMVSAKVPQPSEIQRVLGPSHWIQVESFSQNKWAREEGLEVIRLLQQLRAAQVSPSLYIVTPFVAVARGLKSLVLASRVLEGWPGETESPQGWVQTRIGTLHTAQGREAEAIILVLGAPNQDQAGARLWAGQRPNLLNVAVTRAREVVYVIGNKAHWQQAGFFRELVALLSPKP